MISEARPESLPPVPMWVRVMDATALAITAILFGKS